MAKNPTPKSVSLSFAIQLEGFVGCFTMCIAYHQIQSARPSTKSLKYHMHKHQSAARNWSCHASPKLVWSNVAYIPVCPFSEREGKVWHSCYINGYVPCPIQCYRIHLPEAVMIVINSNYTNKLRHTKWFGLVRCIQYVVPCLTLHEA